MAVAKFAGCFLFCCEDLLDSLRFDLLSLLVLWDWCFPGWIVRKPPMWRQDASDHSRLNRNVDTLSPCIVISRNCLDQQILMKHESMHLLVPWNPGATTKWLGPCKVFVDPRPEKKSISKSGKNVKILFSQRKRKTKFFCPNGIQRLRCVSLWRKKSSSRSKISLYNQRGEM